MHKTFNFNTTYHQIVVHNILHAFGHPVALCCNTLDGALKKQIKLARMLPKVACKHVLFRGNARVERASERRFSLLAGSLYSPTQRLAISGPLARKLAPPPPPPPPPPKESLLAGYAKGYNIMQHPKML